MEPLIQKLKEHVIAESKHPRFIHHNWFVQYHLTIVEQISLELCDIYRAADKNMVSALVWLHDYGKILGVKDQYGATLSQGKEKMEELGFSNSFVEKTISYIDMIDKKENLHLSTTPIEVRILSSADGASHLVGPFYYLWWHENPAKHYEELMQDNVRKALKDWNKKIVLPEVRVAFEKRYEFLMEQCGMLPEKFLKINIGETK